MCTMVAPLSSKAALLLAIVLVILEVRFMEERTATSPSVTHYCIMARLKIQAELCTYRKTVVSHWKTAISPRIQQTMEELCMSM